MLYYDFNVKNKTYNLKLTTNDIVRLEKLIGMNPISIFGNGEEVPPVTTMINILWCSLQKYHHGIGLVEAQNIFDDFLEEHTMTDFLPVILEIYKVSGLIAREDDSKNAVTQGI